MYQVKQIYQKFHTYMYTIYHDLSFSRHEYFNPIGLEQSWS